MLSGVAVNQTVNTNQNPYPACVIFNLVDLMAVRLCFFNAHHFIVVCGLQTANALRLSGEGFTGLLAAWHFALAAVYLEYAKLLSI